MFVFGMCVNMYFVLVVIVILFLSPNIVFGVCKIDRLNNALVFFQAKYHV